MAAFLTTSIITFLLFAGAVLIINFCKARAATNSKHELTGMCHRSGGACCSSIATLNDGTSCSKTINSKGEHNNNHAS